MAVELPDHYQIPSLNRRFPIEEEHEIFRRNPWYQHMDNLCRWWRWRSILDGFEKEDQKRAFLPCGAQELKKNYRTRLMLSHFNGVSVTAIEQLVGAVYSQEKLVEGYDSSVDEFRESIDGAGTTFWEHGRSISREALGMGIAYHVLDGPQLTPATSRQEQLESRSNFPFLSFARAEEIIDWELAPDGSLLWAKLRKEVTVAGVEYLELTRYDQVKVRRWRIALRRTEDGRLEQADGAELEEVELPNPDHGLGEVPVYPVYGRRLGPMRGEPIIKGSARADVAAFNEESWAAMSRYRHANPLLKFKSDAEDTQLLVTGNIVRLNEDESLEYEDAPMGAFEAREQAIKRLRQSAIASTGMNPAATGDAATTTERESGIAQRVRFTQTQLKFIREHSEEVERTAKRVLQAAEMVLTNRSSRNDKAAVSLKSTFELNEVRDLVEQYKELAVEIPSETWRKEFLQMIAQLALKKVREDVGRETLERIRKEIANADVRFPEEVIAGGA